MVVANEDKSFYAGTQHYITQLFTQLNPGTPFVIILCASAVFEMYGTARKWIFNQTTLLNEVKEMTPVQRINPYFEVLKQRTKIEWIREEVVCRERIHMQRLRDESFNELVATQDEKHSGRKKLIGVHNYDILSN